MFLRGPVVPVFCVGFELCGCSPVCPVGLAVHCRVQNQVVGIVCESRINALPYSPTPLGQSELCAVMVSSVSS